jgi:hypothetical protein
MVAGDALIGVVVAFMIGLWPRYADFYDSYQGMLGSMTGGIGPILALVAFALLTLTLAYFAFRGKAKPNSGDAEQ